MKKIIKNAKIFTYTFLFLSIFSLNAMEKKNTTEKSKYLIKNISLDNMESFTKGFSWDANDRYIASKSSILSIESEKITDINKNPEKSMLFVPKHERVIFNNEDIIKFNPNTGKIAESEENFTLETNYNDTNIIKESFGEDGNTFSRTIKDGDSNNLIIKNYIIDFTKGEYLVKKPIKINTNTTGSIIDTIYAPNYNYLPIIFTDANEPDREKLKIINIKSKKELTCKDFDLELKNGFEIFFLPKKNLLITFQKNSTIDPRPEFPTTEYCLFNILELKDESFKIINKIYLPYSGMWDINNSKNLLAITNNKNNNIEIINLKSGKVETTFIGHESKIKYIGFSNNDKMLASCDKNNLKIWRIEPLEIKTIGKVPGDIKIKFKEDKK